MGFAQGLLTSATGAWGCQNPALLVSQGRLRWTLAMNTCMLAFLGWPEVLAILVVVMLLFGAKKLPDLARGLGSGIKEFKKASREDGAQ